MGRRTKEELIASNYYEWLEACRVLRESKAHGYKLKPADKELLRTLPTPEVPYVRVGAPTADVPVKKKKPVMKKIDFDKNVEWPIKGSSFLCAVFNIPYGDEQCMLFCDRDDCPFHSVGYFRSHGVKF